MEKIDIVKHILRNTNHGCFINSESTAWAPSNVALCKYWGKRDIELHLPITSSLSVSLGNKGAFTRVKQDGDADKCIVNGKLVSPETTFAKRLQKFLNLFRPHGMHYSVEVDANIPIAAGFASSACGFASLVQALNKLYDWRLDKRDLSILARLGSGSACRSIFDGFVEWQRGDRYDGMDGYGVKLDYVWPELRLGMLTISKQEKAISSRDAMRCTVETSPLYDFWPKQVISDFANIKLALARKDFILFGEVAESNASNMHATMWKAKPPIVYSSPETFAAISKVKEIRCSGVPIFYTQDAGPNLQLLFLAEHETQVLYSFPELEVVLPFSDSNATQVVLVDDNDVAIGTSEKLAAHIQGKLHRAFSVMILRKRNNKTEVLLQQRSSFKYHSANLWSNTCCGHPKPGEDIVAAAERRLYEEMGISIALKEVGQFHYKEKFSDVNLVENEVDHVLVGFSDLEGEGSINSSEVQNFCWVSVLELLEDLQCNPGRYTIWLTKLIDLLHVSRIL